MREHCRYCGTKFTAKETKEFLEALEYTTEVDFICDECFGDREQNWPYRDEFSDSDNGL